MGMAEEYLELVDERAQIKQKTPICSKQPPFAGARLNVGTKVWIKPQSGVGWKDQPLPDKFTGKEGNVTEVSARWVRVKLDNGIERTFSMTRIEVINGQL